MEQMNKSEASILYLKNLTLVPCKNNHFELLTSAELLAACT